MIAENNIFALVQTNIELPKNRLLILIKECMVETVPHFKSYLNAEFHTKKKLNENELSQFYIKQAQIHIRKKNYPFNVDGQYQDVYNESKGFSDLFFYPNEQDVSLCSIYSVECKRLPASQKEREKEYIIGNKNNGGIERYKTEKHGKGLRECGLLAFIEKKNFEYWNKTINNWIDNLSRLPKSTWKTDEALLKTACDTDYCIFKSIAHRISDNIKLTHLWILIN